MDVLHNCQRGIAYTGSILEALLRHFDAAVLPAKHSAVAIIIISAALYLGPQHTWSMCASFCCSAGLWEFGNQSRTEASAEALTISSLAPLCAASTLSLHVHIAVAPPESSADNRIDVNKELP